MIYEISVMHIFVCMRKIYCIQTMQEGFRFSCRKGQEGYIVRTPSDFSVSGSL